MTAGTLDGHPVRLYEHRPRALSEFLLEARWWGDREILVQGGRRYTYAEFERAVAATAEVLRLRGIGVGDRVLLLGFTRSSG